MKNKILLFALLLAVAAGASAKKVKVTIDGTAYPNTRLYLIVNEDTANAQLLDTREGKFSVTLKVDKDAFIRIHDYKDWPERSAFVIIPDSKHITMNWRNGEISGSEMTQKLRLVMDAIKKESPEGFHIDVFSEDKEEWARAREMGERIRMKMEIEQRELIYKSIHENEDTNIPAWIYFCYKSMIGMSPETLTAGKSPKWLNHPIIKLLKEREKK